MEEQVIQIVRPDIMSIVYQNLLDELTVQIDKNILDNLYNESNTIK